VSDLPVNLPPGLSERLAAALDVEGKIPRALDALGPIVDRDVALVDAGDGLAKRLEAIGARVHRVGVGDTGRYDRADHSSDAVVACWSAFRAPEQAELAEADRVLRPHGRLLVVHDYGRDDVSKLYTGGAPRPEYLTWSRRDGPFLLAGFKVRVVHCWWTFPTTEAAREFVAAAFGAPGEAYAAELKRPRLSYNVAIYHRTFDDDIEMARAG
jgi:SAM-dependent methyltransferase